MLRRGRLAMPVYLVERYLPGITIRPLATLQQAVLESSQSLTEAGHAIRYLRSIFLPGESRCLCLFQAEDAELTRVGNDTAGFGYIRILNALDRIPDRSRQPQKATPDTRYHVKGSHGSQYAR